MGIIDSPKCRKDGWEKRRLRHNLIPLIKYPKSCYMEEGIELFCVTPEDDLRQIDEHDKILDQKKKEHSKNEIYLIITWFRGKSLEKPSVTVIHSDNWAPSVYQALLEIQK